MLAPKRPLGLMLGMGLVLVVGMALELVLEWFSILPSELEGGVVRLGVDGPKEAMLDLE